MRYKSYRRYRHKMNTRHNQLYTGIYRLAMIVLTITAFALVYLINEDRNYVDLTVLKEKISQIELPSLSKFIPYEKWFSGSTVVSGDVQYQPVSEEYYRGDDNHARLIADGIVLLVKEEDGIVMMEQDNGVIAMYGSLQDITVQNNERLLKGSTIGTYAPYLYLHFTYGGDTISYAEALSYRAD